ncbi:DUF1398 domain-containing protein [Azospirillum sp. A39]|uniref:DUF1398 domain-containing protein n=1 Tax=Azospirillum sp. A39 TaxID=3462279 RepID=UPI004046637B
MDADRAAVAKTCLDAAHGGGMSFPELVGTLIGAGFEGYAVDYRRNSATYFLTDGDSVQLDMPPVGSRVAPVFDARGIAACVREAQANAPGYTYRGFCETVKGLGCAGYLVSFPGRRVVYFGRTAETHVEHFPQ